MFAGVNPLFDRPVLPRYLVGTPPTWILHQDDLHMAGLEQLKLINAFDVLATIRVRYQSGGSVEPDAEFDLRAVLVWCPLHGVIGKNPKKAHPVGISGFVDSCNVAERGEGAGRDVVV